MIYNNHKISNKMTKTLKTIIASISLLLITSLVNVSEIKAEEVKKDNSNSSVSKEQNKQITTEYKSKLVSKIMKKYNLDPQYSNEVDQCILIDTLNAIIYEDNKESTKIKRDLGISEIIKSCDVDNNCSVNNDVFTKRFSTYDKDGNLNDVITLFFDKSGNKIGYLSSEIYRLFFSSHSMESLQEYEQENFYSLRKNSKKDLDIVNENHSNINLAVKGCYIKLFNNKSIARKE